MKKDFDYNEVPQGYLHCLHAQCTRSTDCLRFLITPYVYSHRPSIKVVNPTHIAGEEECQYFQADRLSRFAIGITHLLDNLPHAQALRIKQILFHHFQRNMYYRIRNKERLIKPSEVSFIHRLFQEEGITEEPVFDEYVLKYDWIL